MHEIFPAIIGIRHAFFQAESEVGMPLAERLRSYLGPDADKFREEIAIRPILRAAYDPDMLDSDFIKNFRMKDYSGYQNLNQSRQSSFPREQGYFGPINIDPTWQNKIPAQSKYSRNKTSTTKVAPLESTHTSSSATSKSTSHTAPQQPVKPENSAAPAAGADTEKEKPSKTAQDQASVFALRFSSVVGLAFLLIMLAFDFMGWKMMLGLSLLLGAVIYLLVFFVVRRNFIRRAFLTVCVGTSGSLVNASMNYRINVGQHLHEWGIVSEPTDFVIKSGSITWPPMVGLLGICTLLFFAVLADNHAQTRLAAV